MYEIIITTVEFLEYLCWFLSICLSLYVYLYLSPPFQDFGDGGAFPECHIAQYPLGMGKSGNGEGGGGGGGGGGSTSNALAVQLDEKGKVKYDVLARQGHSKDKVCSTFFVQHSAVHTLNIRDSEISFIVDKRKKVVC